MNRTFWIGLGVLSVLSLGAAIDSEPPLPSVNATVFSPSDGGLVGVTVQNPPDAGRLAVLDTGLADGTQKSQLANYADGGTSGVQIVNSAGTAQGTASAPIVTGGTKGGGAGTIAQTAIDSTGIYTLAQGPSLVTNAVTTALSISTIDASVALVAGTYYRIWLSTDGYCEVGAAATSSTMPLGAKTPEVFEFALAGGSAPTIHCITVTGTGTAYFTKLAVP